MAQKKKPYKLELSGPRLLMWIAGIFLLLAWSFVLGVLVGRGSIPEKLKNFAILKKELAVLEQRHTNPDPGQGKAAEPDASPEVGKLDFFQKLAEKKEDKVPLAKPNNKRRSPPRTLRANSQVSKAPKSIHFTIQLASFDSANKASLLVKRLAEKGLSAYYVRADTKKGTYYRVRCGDYATREEALSQLRAIVASTGLKGFVCRK